MSPRVADRLGAAAFAAPAPRAQLSERGRAKAIAEGTIPAYELVRLPLTAVAPCPMNPRRNFGSDQDKAALGASLATRQTTACVAVTRAAYVKLWPRHESILNPADAEYVLLNGERRYRSSLHVGLNSLDFVVRDDLAHSQEDFLDALLLENEDRADFDLIERARGIEQLLKACGGNAAEVARRRGKDRSWVGNQVALLTLPHEIQQQLASGTLAERYGRRLARALKEDPTLTAEQLLALAVQIREEERARRDQDKHLRALANAGVLSADNTSQGAAEQLSAPASPTADEQDAVTEAVLPSAALASEEPGVLLSADNKTPTPVTASPTPQPPAPADSPRTQAPVLSADNTQAAPAAVPRQPHQPTTEEPGTAMQADARARVQQLGTTVEERAATLRQGSSPEELEALVEALMA